MRFTLVRLALVIAVAAAACSSSDTDVSAEGTTTVQAPVTAAPDDTAVTEATVAEPSGDIGADMGRVESGLADYHATLTEVYEAEAQAFLDGERDFDVTARSLGPLADAAAATYDALPATLSDDALDELYQPFRDAFTLLSDTNRAGADRYEASREQWETDWQENNDQLNVEIFVPLNDARDVMLQRCFDLAAAFVDAGGPDLNCLGTTTAPIEDGRLDYTETEEAPEPVEIELSFGRFSYQPLEGGYAMAGATFLGGGPKDVPGYFWLGAPTSLADPSKPPEFDAVVDGVPFQADLDDWASGFENILMFNSGEGEVLGYPARFWDIRVNPENPGDLVFALIEAESESPFSAMQLGPPDAWRIYTFETDDGPAMLLLAVGFHDNPEFETAMVEGDLTALADSEPFREELDEFERYREPLSRLD